MKIIYIAFCALIALAIQAHTQTLSIHSTDTTINQKIQLSSIDSITIDKCDSVLYDLGGCDVDIDSVDVALQCGTVYLTAHIDGSPSVIEWTIYDVDGNVVLANTGTAGFSFTLPAHGSYYGTLEISCGGGDERGGDQDEEAFEIDYNLPTAQFDLQAHTTQTGSGFSLDLLPQNQSSGSSPTYVWRVIDSITGSTVTTSTVETPIFSGLDPSRTYTLQLLVTDDNGCTSSSQNTRSARRSCEAHYTWEYSWCEDHPGTDSVTVQFYNQSDYNPDSVTSVTYYWDFGDNSGIDSVNDNPSHVYACSTSPKKFKPQLKIVVVTDSLGHIDSCDDNDRKKIKLEAWTPQLDVHVCCDGRVFFCTDATYGSWSTPGAMNICNAETCQKIKPWLPGRSCGLQSSGGHCGQTYWRYYQQPGTYTVTLDAESASHNICQKRREFKIDSVGCFNKNARTWSNVTFDGYHFKMKFKVIQWPFTHKVIAKIRCKDHKKMKEMGMKETHHIMV
ncbi:MAG: PKD domain-containing protein, partial [Bacteroidota bacterium]